MRLLIGLVAAAWFAAAQSPHVFRSAPGRGSRAKFEGRVVEFSIGGNVVKRDTENIAGSSLFKRNSTLQKRVDPLDPTPDEQSQGQPMFKNPACIRCPNSRDLKTPEGILQIYTTDYFKREILAKDDELHDKCIFYTRGTNPLGPPKLSRAATQLACSVKKYSIWNLWWNENDEKDNYKAKMNHYDPFTPTNRLNALTQPVPIDQTTGLPTRRPYHIEYFENMSRAMAQKCNGRIHLYTTEPFNVDRFFSSPTLVPNIWATTEYPALRVGRNDVRELITIDANSAAAKPPAYSINWFTFRKLADANYRRGLDPVQAFQAANYSDSNLPPWAKPYDLWGELDVHGPKTERDAAIERRDARPYCINFTPNEPDGIDFFG